MKLDDFIDLLIYPIFSLMGGIAMYLKSLSETNKFSWLRFTANTIFSFLLGCLIVFICKEFKLGDYIMGAFCVMTGVYGRDLIPWVIKKYLHIELKNPSQ